MLAGACIPSPLLYTRPCRMIGPPSSAACSPLLRSRSTGPHAFVASPVSHRSLRYHSSSVDDPPPPPPGPAPPEVLPGAPAPPPAAAPPVPLGLLPPPVAAAPPVASPPQAPAPPTASAQEIVAAAAQPRSIRLITMHRLRQRPRRASLPRASHQRAFWRFVLLTSKGRMPVNASSDRAHGHAGPRTSA